MPIERTDYWTRILMLPMHGYSPGGEASCALLSACLRVSIGEVKSSAQNPLNDGIARRGLVTLWANHFFLLRRRVACAWVG